MLYYITYSQVPNPLNYGSPVYGRSVHQSGMHARIQRLPFQWDVLECPNLPWSESCSSRLAGSCILRESCAAQSLPTSSRPDPVLDEDCVATATPRLAACSTNEAK